MKLLVALSLFISASFLQAADRVALVIGNGNYENLQKLTACPRDAAKMAGTFQRIGIRIHGGKPLLNLTAAQMDQALNEFAQALGKDSEAFIYYSGHGAQLSGNNYLIPVGFNARYETEARRQAVSLDSILELLERTESKLRVVILDACRDPGNILPGEPKLKSTFSKGLSEPRTKAPETLVCFATMHGQPSLADDNASFYTEVLAEEILKPVELGAIMRKVAGRVYDATETRQLPFTYGSLLREHFLVSAPGNLPDSHTDTAVARTPPSVPPNSPKAIFFKMRTADQAAAANAAETEAQKSGIDSFRELPSAKPVPERPGFAFSPFGSKSAILDVRGFPPGTQVADPSANYRSFLVP